MSFVPPLTPMVMILRLAAGAELALLEIAGSIVVLAGSVLVTVWAGARVFHTGVLMYGKRPGIREILRWVRQK
jgi:ABC-2 type transport system permease protein